MVPRDNPHFPNCIVGTKRREHNDILDVVFPKRGKKCWRKRFQEMPHIGFFRAVLHGVTGEECLARILGLISRYFRTTSSFQSWSLSCRSSGIVGLFQRLFHSMTMELEFWPNHFNGFSNCSMCSVQVGKTVFLKDSWTTLGFEPRTLSYYLARYSYHYNGIPYWFHNKCPSLP